MDKTEQLAEMVIQAVQFYFEKKVEPILKSIAEVKSDLVIAGSGFASLAALDDIWSKLQALEDRASSHASGPGDNIASEVSRQIALVPPPADGKSVDLGALFTEIGSAVARRSGRDPRDGRWEVCNSRRRPPHDRAPGIADAVSKIRDPEDGAKMGSL